jgi:hypothetical protein
MVKADIPTNAALAVMLAALLVPASSLLAQTPVTAGFRDFSYGSAATAAPTGEKPESKVWWNDGAYWASLFNSQAKQHRIYRFDAATQSWTDTGTALDPRATSKADVLWDAAGGHLYVVSHVFSSNAVPSNSQTQWGRLYRYAYDSTNRRYTLDSGFPVNVTRGTAEALTIAKDSTQRLWITWVEGGKVKINWSGTDDLDWGTPVDLPFASNDITVSTDDISTVIAFGTSTIGVMWTNQLTAKVYFGFRYDTDAPNIWQPLETVLPNGICSGACADDHINLKTDQTGRVFAAVKTSLTTSTAPLLMLLVRPVTGVWESHVIAPVSSGLTRPITLIDEQNNWLYVFATAPAGGGTVYVKSSSLDPIEFAPGVGQPFIKSVTDTHIDNATSTKQNVGASNGLLVLASDSSTRFYLHNLFQVTGVPLVAPSGLSATAVSGSEVDLSWTDAATNEDAYHVERMSGGGAFTEIATLPANTTTFKDMTVLAGTAYSYRVRARNSAQYSTYSNVANATTPAGASQRIKDITFEGGSLTDATSGADRVIGTVLLETVAPLKGAYSARIPNAAASYLEENFAGTDDLYVSLYVRLNAWPSASVRIVQISNAGATVGNILVLSNGRLRLRLDATTIGADSSPLAVGQLYRIGIRQKRGTGGNALLQGFLASGESAFGVPFAATSTGTWTTQANRLRVGGTSTTTGIDVVLDDIRLDSAVMPGPSGQQGTPPAAPTGLGATVVSVGQIDLSWTDASNDETSFSIERAAGAGSFAVIATVGADVVSYSDTTVAANTTYQYRVRARNAAGFSGYSNTATATTPAVAPGAPTNLTATAVAGPQVNLGWTDTSSNEEAFHIERASGGAGFQEIATVDANVVTYTDTTVVESTSYDYRVRARNAQGYSDYSNVASVTTPGPVTHLPIKNITFESGSLTDPTTGADQVTGTVLLETAAPLKGGFSAHVPNTAASYLEERFTAVDDFYVSFYLRINAPSLARLVQVSSSGVQVGNLILQSTGTLRLRVDTTVIGVASAPLTTGQLYRIGLHQKRGSGSNAVLEAFIAAGDQPFGAPFAVTTAGTWTTAADRIRIGASGADPGDVTVDDIRLDAAGMPDPSP